MIEKGSLMLYLLQGHAYPFISTWQRVARNILFWKHWLILKSTQCRNYNKKSPCTDFRIHSRPTIKLATFSLCIDWITSLKPRASATNLFWLVANLPGPESLIHRTISPKAVYALLHCGISLHTRMSTRGRGFDEPSGNDVNDGKIERISEPLTLGRNLVVFGSRKSSFRRASNGP